MYGYVTSEKVIMRHARELIRSHGDTIGFRRDPAVPGILANVPGGETIVVGPELADEDEARRVISAHPSLVARSRKVAA
jgi:hypothetical protein